jgi:hypothetical protein
MALPKESVIVTRSPLLEGEVGLSRRSCLISELQLEQRISPTPKRSSRTSFYHDPTWRGLSASAAIKNAKRIPRDSRRLILMPRA